jgi:hypothetical protein
VQIHGVSPGSTGSLAGIVCSILAFDHPGLTQGYAALRPPHKAQSAAATSTQALNRP